MTESITSAQLATDERDAVQKKTFTKWVNKHLVKVGDCAFESTPLLLLITLSSS